MFQKKFTKSKLDSYENQNLVYNSFWEDQILVIPTHNRHPYTGLVKGQVCEEVVG